MLIPCPACGLTSPLRIIPVSDLLIEEETPPSLFNDFSRQYTVICMVTALSSGCGQSGPVATSPADATDKWNHRVAITPIQRISDGI